MAHGSVHSSCGASRVAGVVTQKGSNVNWILDWMPPGGRGLVDLRMCASGRGHRDAFPQTWFRLMRDGNVSCVRVSAGVCQGGVYEREREREKVRVRVCASVCVCHRPVKFT